MVLVEGENADGVTVDEDDIELSPDGDPATSTGPDQVVSAILGTQEGATEAGYALLSTGVTWSDQVEASALRDVLAAHKMENVMLVSAFLAAAALAQTVGNSTGHEQTALLFIEPGTATLGVVNSADGSVADVHREILPEDDDDAVAKLVEMVSGAEALETRPDAVFVVGSGIDIPLIKPALEAATSLPLSVPEEPETALARGAALASANAPLFASSTATLAYAQDPGTGAVNPFAVAPGYLAVPDTPIEAELADEGLAYSAVPDDEAAAFTQEGPDAHADVGDEVLYSGVLDFRAEPVEPESRKPFLVAMSVLTIFVAGVVALVMAMAVAIRPHVAQRPSLAQSHVVANPAAPAPPAPNAQVPAPPAPAPAPPAPAPAPAEAPVPAPAARPAPAPAAGPAPAPPPALPPIQLPAPAPAPALPAPIPPLIPQLVAPPAPGPPVAPWGGDHGGGGWGHGGEHGRGGFGGGPGIPLPGLHLGF
ncbi:MAG: hypothetical protein JOZ23_17135 [Mycobacterium sp.]|nr:hypothetical protein [Mycobacterium sp.]